MLRYLSFYIIRQDDSSPTNDIEDTTSSGVTDEEDDLDSDPVQIFGFSDSDTEENSNLPEGHICMKKVMLIEELTYDEELKCEHVEEESCFQTYTTVFKKSEIEECGTDYVKDCNIRYEKATRVEKVEVCVEDYVRDCEAVGPEICTTERSSVCETIYHESVVTEALPVCTDTFQTICEEDEDGEEVCKDYPKRVCELEDMTSTKLSPEINCDVVPTEVCGPEPCPLRQAEKICSDEIKEVRNKKKSHYYSLQLA